MCFVLFFCVRSARLLRLAIPIHYSAAVEAENGAKRRESEVAFWKRRERIISILSIAIFALNKQNLLIHVTERVRVHQRGVVRALMA
jgi:hypothetical protein